MLIKILRKVKNNKHIQSIYQKTITIFNTHIGEITPCNPRTSDFQGKRLNLVVPSINKEHVFGGIATAINFFNLLANNQFRLRLILTDAAPGVDDLAGYAKYQFVSMEEDTDDDYQIVAVNDRYNKTLPVGRDDIFVATAWWTAYLAQKFAQWQAITYNQEMKKMVYLIQDYEPGFYQWSSQYALAESTYKYKGPQIAVFNTSLLQEFVRDQGCVFYKQFSFEPKLNKELKKYLTHKKEFNKKKQILIYGRPSTPRNAFTLIIEALRHWINLFTGAREWEILSVGEKHPDINLGLGITVKAAGKLTLEQYAEALSESAIGISLMISPHPSYPPLEMAHFGALVLTNNYANKNLSSWHDNITSLDNYVPDELAVVLKSLCEKYENNNLIGTFGASHINSYLEDSAQFDFIPRIIDSL